MNEECLYRCSINYPYNYTGEKSAVYAVARSKEQVKEYVERHLKHGCTIKNVTICGVRRGMNMYHGKPDRRK